jgi:hypothetical protein
MATANTTAPPSASQTRCQPVQHDQISPATAKATKVKPTSSACSGAQVSSVRAASCAAPHTRDSSGAMMKLCQVGLNQLMYSTSRSASG